jgi:predicted RNase H-like HicB family nuclease
MRSKKLKSPAALLKLPYARVIIPDYTTKSFTGKILEFPGCITQANGVLKTYRLLDKVAASWIMAAQDLGQEIPLPLILTENK